MNVCTNYFSNASCQEIPDDDSSIITANCKQCAPPVKGASQGHADTIQSSISFLKIKMKVRIRKLIPRYPNHFLKVSLTSMILLLNLNYERYQNNLCVFFYFLNQNEERFIKTNREFLETDVNNPLYYYYDFIQILQKAIRQNKPGFTESHLTDQAIIVLEIYSKKDNLLIKQNP